MVRAAIQHVCYPQFLFSIFVSAFVDFFLFRSTCYTFKFARFPFSLIIDIFTGTHRAFMYYMCANGKLFQHVKLLKFFFYLIFISSFFLIFYVPVRFSWAELDNRILKKRGKKKWYLAVGFVKYSKRRYALRHCPGPQQSPRSISCGCFERWILFCENKMLRK